MGNNNNAFENEDVVFDNDDVTFEDDEIDLSDENDISENSDSNATSRLDLEVVDSEIIDTDKLEKKYKKQRALVIAGVGVGLIILAIILCGILLGNNSSGKESNETNKPVDTKPQTGTTQVVKVSDNGGWLEFNSQIHENYTVNSADDQLKVTNIQGYLKGSQIRYVVTGEIVGLKTQVEVVMPASISEKLKIGNVFNIKYSYIISDSKILVIDVSY